MLNLHPFMTTTSDRNVDTYLHTTETKLGNVTVYGVSAHSRTGESLHPNHAVTVELSGDITENEGYTAVWMYSEYWSKPYFDTDLSHVPDKTQGLIVRLKKGGYAVFLPIVSEQYKCDLKGAESGLTAVLFSTSTKLNNCVAPAFCYAEGEDPFAMLAECAKAGMEVLGMGGKVRDERRYPELFEYLGWCSWDSMQIRVSEEGLLQKCREFKEKKIPVRWAILDDMWADIRDFWDADYANFGEMCQLMHSSSLNSFEADPRRFPQGLKHCIKAMNDEGMIVGMWHPTTGYWRGINPDGPLFAEQKDNLIQWGDGRWIPSPEPDKAFMFYNAFHTFLQACGAQFVKIDNQSTIARYYSGMKPIGETARNLQTAIEASVGAHFVGDMINCMGMASENMWNRQSSMISRCSNDFLPENRPWFIQHILQCAYNSLIQGQFYVCDWDMWWSDDGQAVKNSVVRAISGGPVYVSDKLERSRKEILDPLVLDDGRLLRCDKPAVPVLACLTENPETSDRAFLVQNTCNAGKAGMIAAFDLRSDDASVEGAFSPADICGLEDADEYAVYEHFTGTCAVVKRTDVYRFTLKNLDDFKLFNVTPVINGVALIGITEKMVSPKTIVRYDRPEAAETACGGTFAYVENGVFKTMAK